MPLPQTMRSSTQPQSHQTPASSTSFVEIGRPIKLPTSVDTTGIINTIFRARMHVVDLIPVYYKVSYDNTGETFPIKYTLDYKDASKEYQDRCSIYGLDPVLGVRLFVTDEMTANENITISWQENKIASMLNSMAANTRAIQAVLSGMRTLRSGSPVYENKAQAMAEDVVSNVIDKLGSLILSDQTRNQLKSIASTLIEWLGKGYRISFPRIWMDSDYSSTFNLTVRLVSPYGCPKAIKEFVVKPLLYLLLLGSPSTTSGVTYGEVIPVRVRAYGITDIRLGCIESISINRGGQDTVFNFYKQPLSVYLNITIRPLMPGFAVVKPSSHTSTYDYANIEDTELELLDKYDEQFNVLMPTVSAVIDSFRPAPSSIVGGVRRIAPTGRRSTPLAEPQRRPTPQVASAQPTRQSNRNDTFTGLA